MWYADISGYMDILGMPLSHGHGIQVPGISYTDISGYTDILGMPLSYGQGF